MGLAVVSQTKLVVIGIGLAIGLVGLVVTYFGKPVVIALNKLYARLPGRWQYPPWWHRLIGGIFVGIGLLTVVLGAVFDVR